MTTRRECQFHGKTAYAKRNFPGDVRYRDEKRSIVLKKRSNEANGLGVSQVVLTP